jgi:hypothetical protein
VTPGQIVQAVRALVVVIAIALIWAFWHGLVGYITAPFEAQLDASRGNQAAAKAGIDAQNASIDDAKRAGDARKDASAKAVAAAGKPQEARAAAILAKPAEGSTPLERAHRRIDEELGL